MLRDYHAGPREIGREPTFQWSEFSHIEDDKECYTAFNRAIDDCALSLGARSIFDFHCDAQLTKSVSVFHSPEQGPTLFQERSYRHASENAASNGDAATPAPLADEQMGDEDFIKGLDDL